MDKLKEYIRTHEDRLNIERVGGNVWANIHSSIKQDDAQSKPSHKSTFREWLAKLTHSQKDIVQYRRWAFAVVLFAGLSFSFLFRIERRDIIGGILTFNIPVNHPSINRQLQAFESSFGIHVRPVQHIQVGVLSFLGVVLEKELQRQEAIETAVSRFDGANDVEVVVVERVETESLFSTLLHSISGKHIDRKKTTNTAIQKTLTVQLEKKGLRNIALEITDDGIRLLPTDKVKANPTSDTESPQTASKDSPSDQGLPFSPYYDTTFQNITPPKKRDTIKNTRTSLVDFDWLLHTWRTRDSSLNSYHRWVRINDNLYRSFVIKLSNSAEILPGYFLTVMNKSVVLVKGNDRWTLQEKIGGGFIFQREEARFPQKILWEHNKATWRFDLIFSTTKDQTHLYVDDIKNRQLDSLLLIYKVNNPLLFQ